MLLNVPHIEGYPHTGSPLLGFGCKFHEKHNKLIIPVLWSGGVEKGEYQAQLESEAESPQAILVMLPALARGTYEDVEVYFVS